MTWCEPEPTYPLVLLVEVERNATETRSQLQALVDEVLIEDARGEPWVVRRFFEAAEGPEATDGFYEIRGRIPVSPSYPIRALGFELAAALTAKMTGELAGSATPDFPTTAFGAEEVEELPEAALKALDAEPAWPLQVMRCPQAWQLPPRPGGAQRGLGIVIGHPDTGYTYHQELLASLDLDRDYDVISSDTDAEDPMKDRWWWPFDNPGHGTSTGSVITSPEAGSITGAAPDATLTPFRAIQSVVQVSDGDVARAIDRAVTAGAHVISMSLGGVGFYAGIRAAAQRARAAGIIVMAAAGNRVGIVVAPARFQECIAVAATDKDNQPWSGSSRGDAVLISAPGHQVPVAKADKDTSPADPGTRTVSSSGTSYAVAHLAGVAALWLGHHGRSALIDEFGPEGVQGAFEQVLTTVGFQRPPGWDEDDWGVGIVDAIKVLAAELPAPAAIARDAAAVRAEDQPPAERLAALGLVDAEDATAQLCGLLDCDEDEVNELTRIHGPELAYLYAEGELPAAVDIAAGARRARPLDPGALSPTLRERLDGRG